MDLLRRENFSSGAPLEDKIGYSRAVKVGNFVFVGGTTTTTPQGEVEAEGDAYLQTKIVLQKIQQALHKAGAKLSEVYRVRIYVTEIARAQEYMQAYAEFFKEIKPVNLVKKTDKKITVKSFNNEQLKKNNKQKVMRLRGFDPTRR